MRAKIARIAVSAAHDCFVLSIITLEAYCATLTGSPSDVTYDRAHIVPQADEARTDAIFTGIRPRFLQKLLEQKIYKNSCEQYSTQGSRIANKMQYFFCMKAPL